jgi:hypothetical protein
VDDARLYHADEPLGGRERAREDRGREPVLDVVGAGQGLVERREAEQRGHRTEDLPACEVRRGADILEEGRLHEIAVVAAVLAAGEQFPALSTTVLDRLEHRVELMPVDERPELGARVGRVADDRPAHPLEQPLPELVVDVLLDEDAPRRGALLSRGDKRPGVRGLDGPPQVGVRHHDQRVLASELQLHPLAGGRRRLAHAPADRD